MRGIILPPPRPNGTFAFESVLGCEKIGTPKEKFAKNAHNFRLFKQHLRNELSWSTFASSPRGAVAFGGVLGCLGCVWMRREEQRNNGKRKEERRTKEEDEEKGRAGKRRGEKGGRKREETGREEKRREDKRR